MWLGKMTVREDCREDLSSPIVLPMNDVWMTYAEAGQILGIKAESVKRRARAKHWPKSLGNDGLARVRIPDPPHPGGTLGDAPEDNPPPTVLPNPPPDDTRERLVAAETEIRLLREQMADLRADRDALRDALARAAASQAEIVRPVDRERGGVAGLWARLRGRG